MSSIKVLRTSSASGVGRAPQLFDGQKLLSGCLGLEIRVVWSIRRRCPSRSGWGDPPLLEGEKLLFVSSDSSRWLLVIGKVAGLWSRAPIEGLSPSCGLVRCWPSPPRHFNDFFLSISRCSEIRGRSRRMTERRKGFVRVVLVPGTSIGRSVVSKSLRHYAMALGPTLSFRLAKRFVVEAMVG